MVKYELLAEKYLGADYLKMTAQEQLAMALEYSPFSHEVNTRLISAASKTSDEEARGLALKILEFYDDLPGLAKELAEIRREKEPKKN